MGSAPKLPPLPAAPPPPPDFTDEVIRRARSAALKPVGRMRQSTFLGGGSPGYSTTILGGM